MTKELVSMQDLSFAAPNTFVAFDLTDGRQIVGVFERWHLIELRPDAFEDGFTITEAGSRKPVTLPARLIAASWWAPMGYRAEVPWNAGET